jgi:hypothetical protein
VLTPGGSSVTTSCHWRAAPAAIRLGDVGRRADDLAAARVVGAGHDGEQFVVCELGRLDQRDAGIGDLAQVVAGDLGGQADGDAAGAIEQRERQARRQLLRLLCAAVVVWNEIDRALVDLVEQQVGDAGQPRLRVTHRRRAVAVAAAEVALAVDQRIALRKILRHAHQRVVGGLVAVRMEAAQHVADDPGALDRLGAGGAAEAQAHARHRIEDAALHRLLAVAHVGQGAALDDAQRVFEIGALRVRRQVEPGVVTVGGNQVLLHELRKGKESAKGKGIRRVRRR